jgi:hypothetical protein
MGKSQAAVQRILPPKYGDGRSFSLTEINFLENCFHQFIFTFAHRTGINSPRVQANGELLLSARLISEQFIQDENRPYSNLTLMVMQWVMSSGIHSFHFILLTNGIVHLKMINIHYFVLRSISGSRYHSYANRERE